MFAVYSTDVLPDYNSELSWGIAAFIVAHSIVVIISFIFIFLMKRLRRKPVQKQVSPLREIIY